MRKIILITGAGSGIGKSAAFTLAKNGHNIIATTETEDQKKSLAEEAKSLKLESENFEVVKIDIIDPKDRDIINNYNVDVLINGAGAGESGPLSEVPMERIRKNFEINVFGTLAVTQIVLKKMMAKEHGTIITISSLAGRLPVAFMAPYSMTKYALSSGMAAMRKEIHEVQKNVHIVLVEPGAYATGFNQRMQATKYEWLDKNSYFFKIITKLKRNDDNFRNIEEKSISPIVKKIIEAAESPNPHLRYVAPLYQGVFVSLMRILGK